MNKILLGLSTVLLSTSVYAAHPNIDLEMTGPEFAKYFETHKLNKDDGITPAIQNILNVGARNLAWLQAINANRPADAQLPLVTPELQTGVPITAPSKYNEQTVTTSYNTLLTQMPDAFKNVVLATTPLPNTHPLATDDDYLNWTRKLDRVYESASRWTLMAPYLDELAGLSYEDVRGYYFLGLVTNLQDQLNGWSTLTADTQTQYSAWLVLMCHNSQIDTDTCRANLATAVQGNKVWNFYSQYLPTSKEIYDNFFLIQASRPDITWNASNANSMLVPFTIPSDAVIQKWLADNIQDEWKWNGWQLTLAWTPTSSATTTHIVFEAGTTPHVDDVAGSEITMDENSPLQDYGTRWTIRHEYGHTLGFPDCYIEFYDADEKVMINYQLDLDQLMCSRKGHFQQRNFDELKRVYFKNN